MPSGTSKPASSRRSGPRIFWRSPSNADRLPTQRRRAWQGAFEPAGIPGGQVPQVPDAEVVIDAAGALLAKHAPHEAQVEPLAGQGRFHDLLLGRAEQPRGG